MTAFDAIDGMPQSAADPVEAPSTAALTGAAVIRGALRTAPKGPGVYRMIDADGDVLYVGKARSIRRRITSYARGQGHTDRIGRMIAETVALEFVTTKTESEALLLEANLIKRLRPRYNVSLRDDKSFAYILIARDHEAARVAKHRGARSIKGDYFGPFASTWAVNRTVRALQKAFFLRSCSDAVYESRTRPCLLHQIRRCSAPCTGEIDLADYDRLAGEARAFLSGRSQAVKKDLAIAMEAASERLDFESAARYRDRLGALSEIQSQQGINPQTVEEADVFAVHQQGGQTCIQVFFFRTFQNWGNRAYFPRADRSLEPGEVLQSFVAQFYDATPAPRLILLSDAIPEAELLAEALALGAGHAVEIAQPQRGEKRELVRHALDNAREALGRKLAETSSQARLLDGLAETFALERPPRRIEVYDNSHIMGAQPVGAMIVAGPEGFAKKEYRKFNIRGTDISPGDDFGMMREVLERRFSRLVRESAAIAGGVPAADDDAMPARPDLVVIDGGPGQVAAAQAVLDALGIDEVPVLGIAKGRDRDAGRELFHIEGREPFRLEPRDPVLYLVQRLRDEAHRFAIGTHRARRGKELVQSPLDEIAGIGPTRKRALLRHFGSAKGVARAGRADLEKVPGINRATAQLVYDHFHDGPGAS